jgi:glycosyltransferase involved in cell wall biosynthesis
LKILHVAYIYPPELGVADGITNVVFNVTKELAKRGHQVSVYTSDMLDLHDNNSLRAKHLVINGVDVYYSRSVLRSKTFIVTPATISLLSKNIDDFDIIHIHDARSFQGISTYLFAKTKNVPYVFQPHGSYLPSLPDSPSKAVAKTTLDKLVSGEIIGNASKVIALSQVEAQQYKCAGVPDEKIAIIPNGIDLAEYADLPPKGSFKKKFNIQDDKKIILYLGRIHKTKGIDYLINAYAHMIKTMKCNNTLLVIAGPDDGYLNEAKSIARSLGVSNSILFTGFISKEDKLKALVDAEVFVTPSFYGFPITFLEACAVGTPIITTTLGDSLEWINNNVGYVTLPTYCELAQAIRRVLSDEEVVKRFSKNCRETVQSLFSLEKIVSKLEQVYKEVTHAS